MHAHDGGNSHAHAHAHGADRNAANRKRLMLTLALVAAYMVAEVIGGLVSNSLALLADAGHMLSDAAALALSLLAMWIAQRPPNARRTYGYYRAEILAALANGAMLIAIAAYIFVEAYQRLREPPAVMGGVMLAVAVGGLGVNLAGVWILSGGRSESLNVRGAWLHVVSDALGSVGAIVAAGLVWAFGWNAADPAVSALIGVLIIYSSWSLLKESVSVLMESAPAGIDVNEVRDALAEVRGVRSVHDLHVWTITSGMTSLSAHVVAGDARPQGELLGDVRRVLHDRFGINHQTIQVEPPGLEEPGLEV